MLSMKLKQVMFLLIGFGLGWVVSNLFSLEEPSKDEVSGSYRVLIPDNCPVNRLMEGFDYQVVKFDLPMKQLHSSSYIEVKDDRMPDLVLQDIHKSLKQCIVDTSSKTETISTLQEEIGRYFSISKTRPVNRH